MNAPEAITGTVFGFRPGLASGIAVLNYRAETGYRLRGWIITNLTRQYLREWVTAVAQTDVPVMVAVDRPVLPSRHAEELLATVEGLGVPVVHWPVPMIDDWSTDRRIGAARLDTVIKERPLVRLAVNQALYAGNHIWSWPDPIDALTSG